MNKTYTKATKMSTNLSALTGNDYITGSNYNDTLRAGDGNDKLYGRIGKDTLYGGKGADAFVFKKVTDSFAITDTKWMDTIMDFSRTQKDKLDLRGIDAREGVAGNQAFTFIGPKDFTGRKGELAITREGKDLYVGGDTDGDAVPDFAVCLKNVSYLSKGDFYL